MSFPPFSALCANRPVQLLLAACLLGVSLFAQADVPPAPEFEGKWIQGSVLRGRVNPDYRVEFLNQQVPVADDGVFVIGLGRDFAGQASVKLIDQQGNSHPFSYPVTARQYDIQRVEGVPSRTVNPAPADLSRIREDARMVRTARDKISLRQDFREQFAWPLLGPITGVYGSQRVYNGEPRRPHYGVDVYAPVGTRVVAPASGKVILAQPDMFFSGGTLIIDHGHGLSSTFIHLSKILSEVGQIVRQGEPIAEVGATGRATGPHLDWRMNWFDQRVDPQLLVPPMPSEKDAGLLQNDKAEDNDTTVQ